MKKFFLLFSVAAAFALAAEDAPVKLVKIQDFEKPTKGGWQVYASEGTPGGVSFTDDTICGENAIKITVTPCKKYRGVIYHDVPKMPENAVALTFMMKPIQGSMPHVMGVSLRQKPWGKVLDGGTGNIKVVGNDWQKVRLDLTKLRSNMQGPNFGKPITLKPGIYSIAWYVPAGMNTAEFLLDDIAWEVK